MKLVVAGGRDVHLSDKDYQVLEKVVNKMDIDEIITGGATGVDTDAIEWAKARGVKTRIFAAEWERHGRMAGPIRNREMALYADVLLHFPGGKGTQSMIMEARSKNLLVIDGTTKMISWNVQST